MRKISATLDVAVPPEDVWPVVRDSAAFPRLADQVIEVERFAGTSRWSVLLNGSQVDWVQREGEENERRLWFEQVEGDFEALRGEWTLAPTAAGTRLDLRIEFHLGIDGLAPLLDPIWSQSLRAYAEMMVRAVGASASAKEHP